MNEGQKNQATAANTPADQSVDLQMKAPDSNAFQAASALNEGGKNEQDKGLKKQRVKRDKKDQFPTSITSE